MAPGNLVDFGDLATAPGAQSVDHWYFLAGVDAWLPKRHGALVVVGDSITDGRGSTTNANDRWPDQLLARLQKGGGPLANIAVINEAAGGNRVLYDGLGPNALGRIDRDVLSGPAGARYALVYEGVNDIGTCSTDPEAQRSMADRLIAAFDQIATRLHRAGIPAFGATITPFCGDPSVQPYSNPVREAQRQRVNEWIRSSGRFDAVVDFDAAVRDPRNASQLNPEFDSGDHLHLNPAGYKVMAEAVDLTLFTKFADGVQRML
ncbi:hypothetical protein VTK73DRAFT_6622 [Phialemonium thermophilum]|uniref:SGNH hydrolase-type esterase domain-containing protein n=1 Tax=Phialemonium thermophilum TaxID=223376 RepID=A0ABR3XW35_9PEZI